jgi:hypothetical protein
MLVRLIQVIHWFVFIIAILYLSTLLIILIIENEPKFLGQLIEYMLFIDIGNMIQIFLGIVFDCTIIMPFIRFIIFGRFGWFPWSPFRKE